jgi:hypothetical protein
MANNPYTSANQQQNSRPKKTSGAAMMARGAILAVVGIVISMISYSCASAAASSGSTGYYTVFYGAIVIGINYFIVGFFKMLAGR